MSLLSVDNLTIRFGGLVAVNNVSFAIEPGDLFGLIGPNGAGKTTVFNMVTGVYKPTSGSIQFRGESLCGLRPHQIARKGVCRTFQNIRLFGSLTALENVMVGAFLLHHCTLAEALACLPRATSETFALRQEALDLLELMNLSDVSGARAADLPYGKQRRLEIARAMATKPELILLDEPAAGMNPQESEDLLKTVRKLRDSFGKTVLLIEHDMRFVMNLCERIVVLDHGEEIAAGPPEAIRNNPKVIEAYLGEAV